VKTDRRVANDVAWNAYKYDHTRYPCSECDAPEWEPCERNCDGVERRALSVTMRALVEAGLVEREEE